MRASVPALAFALALALACGSRQGPAPAPAPAPTPAPPTSAPALSASGGYAHPITLLEAWSLRTGCRLDAVAVLDDGTVVVGGGFQDYGTLVGVPLHTPKNESALVAAFDPGGGLLWNRASGDAEEDRVVRILALGTDALVAGVRTHDKEVQGYLALFGRDGTKRWEKMAGALLVGPRWRPEAVTVGAPNAMAPAGAHGDGAWLLFAAGTGSSVVRVDLAGNAAAVFAHADATVTEDTRAAVDSSGAEYLLAEGVLDKLMLTRYAPDGTTWEKPVAAPFQRGTLGLTGGLAVDAGGDAFVAWEDHATGVNVARVRAADGTRVWTTAMPAHFDDLGANAPATELVGFDRDPRTGSLFVSLEYRLPFALAGVPLPGPRLRVHGRGPTLAVDLVSRAVAQVAPDGGRVEAAGPVAPTELCTGDYATRIAWWPGFVFSGGEAYVVTGLTPRGSMCLTGPEGAVIARLSMR